MTARDEEKIRVLSLNAHKGFSHFNRRFVLHELRDSIREISADVVFLQEVVGEHERKAQKVHEWPEMSQYEFLADSVWSDYAYGKNAAYPAGHHGNAILSKYPIIHFKQLDISSYVLEQRGLLHCEMALPGRASGFHAICIHLGLIGRHRKKQFDMLRSYIEKNIPREAPLIVAGDFNDWTQQANRFFAEPLGLSEAFEELTGKPSKSFPSFFPLLPLDRVYFRGFQIQHSQVLSKKPWSQLSDHTALEVETVLPAAIAEGSQ